VSEAGSSGSGPAISLDRAHTQLASLREQIGRVIVGMDDVVEELLVALLADGHVLLEGPPGLGKTLLVRTLAGSLSLAFRRLQCTPDLMPGDVTGAVLLSQDGGAARLSFAEGPVFTNVLLVDEINRATPKTQAALLEAMEERHVTAGGETRPLPEPFLVLATQNPVEMEGTYPLPEAQLDRFLLKVLLQAPGVADLEEIVRRTTSPTTPRADAVLDAVQIAELRALVRQIALAPTLLTALSRTVAAAHPDSPEAPAEIRRLVRYGASPRGARALALAAKARAVLAGRPHVALEDLRRAFAPALRHRLILSFEAEAEGIDADTVLREVAPLLDAS
jgi:MoxR-like ATPase